MPSSFSLQNRYEWWVGLRYLRAKRAQHFISVITLLSMGGIALGVAALIVVLAVMTGFRETLQQQILGITSHVTIRASHGNMVQTERLLADLKDIPGVIGAAPYITGQAMLQSPYRTMGIALRGMDIEREAEVSNLKDNLVQGSLDHLPGFGIFLGKQLASNLGVLLGDRVTLIAATLNVTAMGSLPRIKRFRVAGIFDTGMYEYDNTLAYIHLKDAQVLLRMGNQTTGIEIKTPQADTAFQVRERLKQTLGSAYWIQDWMEMNHNFFRALRLEKATMFVILFLVVLVAAFNIVSSLIMAVMEKHQEIAILKTMGATSGSIMTIFIINGGIIGVTGTIGGLILGLAIAFNLEPVLDFIEQLFGIQILSGEVYYIDHLPATVVVSDVIWITTISMAISLLATLYPAWRAAQVDPVEALRYE